MTRVKLSLMTVGLRYDCKCFSNHVDDVKPWSKEQNEALTLIKFCFFFSQRMTTHDINFSSLRNIRQYEDKSQDVYPKAVLAL